MTLTRIPSPSNHEERRAQFCLECHSGSTDCNIPLSLGIPSICVGCYRGKGVHTREEYVEIDSLAQGYKVVFGMILSGYFH